VDLTCQKGLENTLEMVLIVVQSGITGAEEVRAECLGGIFTCGISMFWLVAQQPTVPW
jgi:hypothetical protein